jgi:hypothetical protein
MFLTLAFILLVCWLIGLGLHLLGGIIHVLLVLAIAMAIMHFVRGGGSSRPV